MIDGQDTTTLHEEHLMLGALMGTFSDTELMIPQSYPSSENYGIAQGDTILSDLTGLPYALLSGSEAQEIAEMAFGGKRLSVGESAFEPAFFGDGTLVGIPFIMRTGEHEYCLLDLVAHDDRCMEWALALTQLKQGDQRLFPESSLEDATDFLLPLLLWGKDASFVLSDYLSDGVSLPAPGQVISCKLDSIHVIVSALPGLVGSYLLLVPPSMGRVLWRSLLSFACVQPAGMKDLSRELKANLEWHTLIDDPEQASASVLTAYELIRTDGQFVGMRGLLEG